MWKLARVHLDVRTCQNIQISDTSFLLLAHTGLFFFAKWSFVFLLLEVIREFYRFLHRRKMTYLLFFLRVTNQISQSPLNFMKLIFRGRVSRYVLYSVLANSFSHDEMMRGFALLLLWNRSSVDTRWSQIPQNASRIHILGVSYLGSDGDIKTLTFKKMSTVQKLEWIKEEKIATLNKEYENLGLSDELIKVE